MTYRYELSHPQLSTPLEMSASIPRSRGALEAWATMYILRNFDEMVEPGLWEVAGPHDAI